MMEMFDPYTGEKFSSSYNYLLLLPLIYSLTDTHWVKMNTFFKWTFYFNNNIFMSMENSNYKYKFINMIMVSLMTYILLMNLLGMMPYNFTMTASPSINFSLSIIFFLAISMNFLKNQEKILGHLVPKSSPTTLIFMLVMIETLSIMIRPITLGLRITANIMAGHVILVIMGSMIKSATLKTVTTIIFITLMNGLELMVAVIQAYVMMMLLNYYMKDFAE